MIIKFRDREYYLERYPESDSRSLQPFSAADEHLLRYLEENLPVDAQPVICHDRFGALTVPLYAESPVCMISSKSQLIAIRRNLERNTLDSGTLATTDPLAPLQKDVRLALIRIPKAMEEFRNYLYRLSDRLTADSTVLCSFMTRHFSPQLLSISGEFFGSVEQSLAWKKSRVLILREPAPFQERELLNSIPFGDGGTLSQYPGVFSSQRVDSATSFLLDHLTTGDTDQVFLDMGCGNGVIGLALRQRLPEAEIHLMDDEWLAVESAKLNLGDGNSIFHWTDTLDEFRDGMFDMVVSNPPFHFEYEIDITVPLNLFRDVKRILKPSGVFILVANRHLNYRTHLNRAFSLVNVVATDDKFEVLRCYC